jgi:hypothetical protein
VRTIIIAVIIIVVIGAIAAGLSFMQGSGVQRDMAPADLNESQQVGS